MPGTGVRAGAPGRADTESSPFGSSGVTIGPRPAGRIGKGEDAERTAGLAAARSSGRTEPCLVDQWRFGSAAYSGPGSGGMGTRVRNPLRVLSCDSLNEVYSVARTVAPSRSKRTVQTAYPNS